MNYSRFDCMMDFYNGFLPWHDHEIRARYLRISAYLPRYSATPTPNLKSWITQSLGAGVGKWESYM